MLDIEVGRSVEDVAAADGLFINPARHAVLPDGDYIKGARRHTGLDCLFIYRHRETERFVLAGWTVPGRVCVELLTWGGEHLLAEAPSYSEIAYRTRPTYQQRQERIEAIRAAKYRERMGRSISDQHRQEQINRAAARGDRSTVASLLTSPYTSREEAPAEFDATMDKMVEAGKQATPKISTAGLQLPPPSTPAS